MKLLTYAQPASLGAWPVGAGPRQELPLDPGLQTLIFKAPHIPGQPGVLPLAGVLEVRLVVGEPGLPGGGSVNF